MKEEIKEEKEEERERERMHLLANWKICNTFVTQKITRSNGERDIVCEIAHALSTPNQTF